MTAEFAKQLERVLSEGDEKKVTAAVDAAPSNSGVDSTPSASSSQSGSQSAFPAQIVSPHRVAPSQSPSMEGALLFWSRLTAFEFGHLRSRLGAAVAIDLISTSEYPGDPDQLLPCHERRDTHQFDCQRSIRDGNSARANARCRLLRHRLGNTGTHVGCEQGKCGMCTVKWTAWR